MKAVRTAESSSHKALWEKGLGEYQAVREDGLVLEPWVAEALFSSQPGWGAHCPDDGLFWETGWHRLGTFRRGGTEFLRPTRPFRSGPRVLPVVTRFSWHRDCAEWAGVAGPLADAAYQQHLAAVASLHRQEVYEAKLQRPQGFHPGQVLYLDGSGLMNPAALRAAVGREAISAILPQGFVLTAFTGSKGVWQEAHDLVTKVAFGPHGHGMRYERKYPFVLVGIAHPDDESPASRSRLEAGLQRLVGRLGDLPVRHHLYTAPRGV
jgi:hypothetical protein